MKCEEIYLRTDCLLVNEYLPSYDVGDVLAIILSKCQEKENNKK